MVNDLDHTAIQTKILRSNVILVNNVLVEMFFCTM